MKDNYFTILWWFLPNINMNQPWVNMCPPILNPPHTSLPTPSLWVDLASSALFHASNLHWSSILHVVMCMFQSYSLKLSHPRLLPLSLKVCSLRLCLLCCPACRVIGTAFLNSIYMRSYTVFLFFWLTSVCITGSRFIHLIRTDSRAFLFILE